MNAFGFGQAILLGIVQGLTEFLPISSSGHLVILQRWLGLDAGSSEMLLFDVVAHVGTLGAVLLVFWRTIRRFLYRLRRETQLTWTKPRSAWRFLCLGAAAVVPTAVIGLAFKDSFESAFSSLRTVGACLMVTGFMLAVTMKTPRGRRGWRQLRLWQAILVGIVQGLAILPGISRSGATICLATYCGWRRRWAVEFSFLIAVPAILGATLIQVLDTMHLSAEPLNAIALGPILVGGLISLLVGVFALKLLLHIVRRGRLHYFAIYCWFVGILTLIADT